MFWIEHHKDFLDRMEADRQRVERRNQLVRALRGSTPPFSDAAEAQLREVMREQLNVQTEPGR